MKTKFNIAKIVALSSIFIIFDQVTKYLSLWFWKTQTPVIGDLFYFKYTENPGIAFSIMLPFWLIIVLNLALFIILGYFVVKELNLESKLTKLASAFIFAGGIGNLIDRVVIGNVIDFIKIWKWPTFNLADIYVAVGILLIIIFYSKVKKS